MKMCNFENKIVSCVIKSNFKRDQYNFFKKEKQVKLNFVIAQLTILFCCVNALLS